MVSTSEIAPAPVKNEHPNLASLANLQSVDFFIEGKKISIPISITPPSGYRQLYSKKQRKPLNIQLDSTYADHKIPKKLPLQIKVGQEDVLQDSEDEDSAIITRPLWKPIKAFDFYGHGTNLYSFLMTLNFTDGKLIGRKKLSEEMNLPVPHGEKGGFGRVDTSHVSVTNYGYGDNTSLNRNYAETMARSPLITDENNFERVRKRHEFATHRRHSDYAKADFETLDTFRSMLKADVKQRQLYETLSRIPVVTFGDSDSDVHDQYENRATCYGLVDEMTIRFVCCPKEHVSSVKSMIDQQGFDIKVYSLDMLEQVDAADTYRKRRDILQKLVNGNVG